ncbi:DUF7553 family protein [Haloarchaeobius sp. HME9146]|uniref:DUF7553 family protein n=1 Tax=unclassified Haloarchaeobius TaxID=2614452 RepID=UPI0021C1298C|nr:hypothetical protein [Haloarchaeobius sp. HME9146]MCT9097397.1 hypothetical protein [Haloarchaeobius sp. HME9146]
MNKHFKDAQYYLKRAGEHTKEGAKEEFETLQQRFDDLRGKESEPEPSRVEKLQQDLKSYEKKAEGKVKENVREARKKLDGYRKQEA